MRKFGLPLCLHCPFLYMLIVYKQFSLQRRHLTSCFLEDQETTFTALVG
jgi:hypothetical protein